MLEGSTWPQYLNSLVIKGSACVWMIRSVPFFLAFEVEHEAFMAFEMEHEAQS